MGTTVPLAVTLLHPGTTDTDLSNRFKALSPRSSCSVLNALLVISLMFCSRRL